MDVCVCLVDANTARAEIASLSQDPSTLEALYDEYARPLCSSSLPSPSRDTSSSPSFVVPPRSDGKQQPALSMTATSSISSSSSTALAVSALPEAVAPPALASNAKVRLSLADVQVGLDPFFFGFATESSLTYICAVFLRSLPVL